MEYDNNNRGVLFKNDRKEKDTHPDYRGNIEIEGKEFYIKGWKKESKKGTAFLSLAVDAKEGAAPKAPSQVDANDTDPF
jgi:uncharacterized protein (DUF736 family)|tara:strand:- start:938 stop:1174 length:237 start_codon:yes stop_codon:yes gene_type:complete